MHRMTDANYQPILCGSGINLTDCQGHRENNGDLHQQDNTNTRNRIGRSRK